MNYMYNTSEYNLLPRSIKDNYIWKYENDMYIIDRQKEIFNYKVDNFVNYIETNDNIMISRYEYNNLPLYLKKKYLWIEETNRNEYSEWTYYRKYDYDMITTLKV